MKKTAFAIVLVTISLFLMSFVCNPIENGSDSGSNWKAKTTETLYNGEYDMTLTLYPNGYVALKSAAGPAAGRYEIDKDNWITLNWEDGDPESGFVTTVQTTSGMRIKTVVVKGVTFTNTERFVVSRH